MKVEIWSDVMCPFCYIGKRKFENALAQHPHKDDIEIEWKSFQLDPDIVSDPTKTVDQFLAERKGISQDRAREMNEYVTRIAAKVGLDYHFEKAVVANSFDAHRFSHLAKKHGLQDKAEEQLFKAYFIEGKNTADKETLVLLGAEIGLAENETRQVLEGDDFAQEVEEDIYMAQQFGIQGVPFFVFDRKYAVSGAQEPEVFAQVIEKSFNEWRAAHPAPAFEVIDGPVCTPDGNCD